MKKIIIFISFFLLVITGCTVAPGAFTTVRGDNTSHITTSTQTIHNTTVIKTTTNQTSSIKTTNQTSSIKTTNQTSSIKTTTNNTSVTKTTVITTMKPNVTVMSTTKVNTTQKATTIPQITYSEFRNLYASAEATVSIGTMQNPTTLLDGLSRLKEGYTLYVANGTYLMNSQINLTTDFSGRNIEGLGNDVVLDFQSQYNGVVINGNEIGIKKITIKNSKSYGLEIIGNSNNITNCSFMNNQDSGICFSKLSSETSYLEWPSNNYIKDCISCLNIDTTYDASGYEGKRIGKGNVFDGCIAAYNVNCGFDFENQTATGVIGSVELKNCLAIKNGISVEDEAIYANSVSNGYRLGGAGGAVNHVITNCLAAFNKGHGFTDNGNIGQITYNSCTAFNNGFLSTGKKANFHCKNSAARHIYSNILSIFDGDNASVFKDSDKIYGNVQYSLLFHTAGSYFVGEEQEVLSNTSSTRGVAATPAYIIPNVVFENYSCLLVDDIVSLKYGLNEIFISFLRPLSTFAYCDADGDKLGAHLGGK